MSKGQESKRDIVESLRGKETIRGIVGIFNRAKNSTNYLIFLLTGWERSVYFQIWRE